MACFSRLRPDQRRIAPSPGNNRAKNSTTARRSPFLMAVSVYLAQFNVAEWDDGRQTGSLSSHPAQDPGESKRLLREEFQISPRSSLDVAGPLKGIASRWYGTRLLMGGPVNRGRYMSRGGYLGRERQGYLATEYMPKLEQHCSPPCSKVSWYVFTACRYWRWDVGTNRGAWVARRHLRALDSQRSVPSAASGTVPESSAAVIWDYMFLRGSPLQRWRDPWADGEGTAKKNIETGLPGFRFFSCLCPFSQSYFSSCYSTYLQHISY